MTANGTQELVLLDQASQALAEARSFDQIKEIRDKAEAVRKYAQSASLGLDIQNRAAEVKLRAERQAGKLLSQMMLRGGDRRSKNHHERLKLEDIGISRNQSTRWQMQARVPEDVFQEHVRQVCEAGQELTSARLLRLARQWEKSGGLNGNCNGKAGHRPSRRRKSKRFVEAHGNGASGDPVGEIVSELANHHQLLDNILRPVYSGETVTLEAAERRVLRYLLLETQQLLARLGKMRQRHSFCVCNLNGPGR